MRLGQGLGQRPQLLMTILALLTMLTLLGSLSACSQGEHLTAIAPTAAPLKQPNIPESATTLGGSVVSFDKKFGASNCCYVNGWNYQGPYGPMWTGVRAGEATGNTYFYGLDETSHQRVIAIDNAGWMDSELNLTMTQAKVLCGSFLPADAKLQRTSILSYGSELRYTSVLLANTLPDRDFTDKNGKATPSGTIFVYYANPGGTVDYCRLSTDEHLLYIPS